MSGIYIKGAEMPKDCDSCEYKHCDLWKPMDVGEKHPHCPIIPVPDHGRLIDEAALLTSCVYIIADGMACIPVKYIANTPTIIPADKEEV